MDRHNKRKPGIMRRTKLIKGKVDNTVFPSRNGQEATITAYSIEDVENDSRKHKKDHTEESPISDESKINENFAKKLH